MLNAYIVAIYLQKYRKKIRKGFIQLVFVWANGLDLT